MLSYLPNVDERLDAEHLVNNLTCANNYSK